MAVLTAIRPFCSANRSLVYAICKQGNAPYSNPSHIADDCGWELPFIHGLRAEQDYIEAMQAGLIDPPEPADESDLI